MPRRPARAARAAMATSALAVLLLAACASEDPVNVTPLDPGGAASDSATSEPAPAPSGSASDDAAAPGTPVAAEITVVVDDGAGTSTTQTLTCEPVGGDVPDPQAACDQLAGVGAEGLAPLKADQMCTMIYGGPQTATVTGTLGGTPVSATFDRTNGCAIDRWDSLDALLGAVGD